MRQVNVMSDHDIEWELSDMEDSYGKAFEEESPPDLLQFIWQRIKELRKELEIRSAQARLFYDGSNSTAS